MYIIMKLIYIGIFFMLIIILQIYKIIGEKGKIIKETFDLIKKFKLQDRFRKDSIRYRLETGDKNSKTKQVLKDISYQNFNDFIMLDSNNVLVPYKNTVEGYDNQTLKKTKKDIDKCRSLTKCDQLKLNPQCGIVEPLINLIIIWGIKLHQMFVQIIILEEICGHLVILQYMIVKK